MDRIERSILRNLIYDEDYCRKVIPFIKKEYFNEKNEKIIFEEIYSFIEKYNKLATQEILYIEVSGRTDLNESGIKEINSLISELTIKGVDSKWLTDSTEKWCK